MTARRLFIGGIIVAFLFVTGPFVMPVAMGAVFAVLLYPAFDRLVSMKFPRSASAIIVTFGVTILFLVPAAFLVLLGAKAAIEKLPALKGLHDYANQEGLLQIPAVHRIADFLKDWLSIEFSDVVTGIQDFGETLASKLAQSFGVWLTSLPGVLASLLIVVMSIFFFLIDAKRMIELIYKLSPLPQEQTEHLLRSFASICRALILATVIVGFTQAAIYSLTCLFLGMKSVTLIGFSIFLMSFLPLIGSAPVTFGIPIYQFMIGNYGKGIILLALALIVAVIENVIRPLVLRAANLHPLLAFVSVFGGLETMGFPGVFLGPIIAGLFATTVNLILVSPKVDLEEG